MLFSPEHNLSVIGQLTVFLPAAVPPKDPPELYVGGFSPFP